MAGCGQRLLPWSSYHPHATPAATTTTGCSTSPRSCPANETGSGLHTQLWVSIFICVTTQLEREPGREQVELAVETLKLLADQTRLRILWALLHGEHSVSHLAEHVGAQPSAVS